MKFLPLFFILFLGFTSCEDSSGILTEEDFAPSVVSNDALVLAGIHTESKLLTSPAIVADPKLQTAFVKAIGAAQIELESSKSLQQFWVDNDMVDVMNAAEFFIAHENDSDVYSQIAQEYNLSELEYEKMFLVVEVSKIVPEVLDEKSWGCAASVAGYTVTVFSAIAITGPVGLGFWVAGIVTGGGGIIASCQ